MYSRYGSYINARQRLSKLGYHDRYNKVRFIGRDLIGGIHTLEDLYDFHDGDTISAYSASVVGQFEMAHQNSSNNTQSLSGTWTVPSGVTSISVLAIGGGGGAAATGSNRGGGGGSGGAMAWVNDVSVIPGQVYQYFVGGGGDGGYQLSQGGQNGQATYIGPAAGTQSYITGYGGVFGRLGRTSSGTSFPTIQQNGGYTAGGLVGSWLGNAGQQAGVDYGGYDGGAGGAARYNDAGGGGGGGPGYTGRGGTGAYGNQNTGGTSGQGGGGGGGNTASSFCRGGGGVGIYGIGANGGVGGNGGSGGFGGNSGNGNSYGGLYGAGGGADDDDYSSATSGNGPGGAGALRIIWPGNERQWPGTRTADE